jgi:hypothetical protein
MIEAYGFAGDALHEVSLMTRTRAFTFAMSACAATLGFAALGACASDHEAGAPVLAEASVDRAVAVPRLASDAAQQEAAAIDAAPAVDAASADAGACNVHIDAVPIMDSPHVPEGTAVVYSSNPPSSGPHYDRWANFQELTHPVDDGYLVHSMEHGAVLLLYACQGAACETLVPQLRAVRDAVPTDSLCDPAIRTRVILAPRAANGVAVAAAAWGYVYRADCVDAASLRTFILDHYAKAPENFCAAGQVF